MTTWREAEEIFRQVDPNFERWTDAQELAYRQWDDNELQRMLVFFPTGKGKTKTTLGLIASRGHKRVIVIAPPKTHGSWQEDAAALGLSIRVDSVQTFRMPGTSYPRDVPFIVDEFHMLGGHTGAGWKKLNRMATRMEAEIIMSSATPNYNDAERVFCITAIGDNEPVRNFLDWLYATCDTKQDPFKTIPIVTGFKIFGSALEYLVNLPYTAYIEDNAVWTSGEIELPYLVESNLTTYGYDERSHKIMNSQMEASHVLVNNEFIGDDGLIRPEIMMVLWAELYRYQTRDRWLIFCNHKTVAEALARTLPPEQVFLITGGSTKTRTEDTKNAFLDSSGGIKFLIGTTALATGVDGIDKVCQSMIILDDVIGDPSLRRQLIGRILPRGTDDGIERIVLTATY